MEGRRICFVMGGYFEQAQGGAEYQAYLLARRLIELGHDVHYIHADTGRPFKLSLPLVLHSIRRGILGKRLPRYAFMWEAAQVAGILRQIDPDIVYQRGAQAYTWAAGSYARATGKCLVWHIAHENDVSPLQWNWRNLLYGRSLEKRLVASGIRNAEIIVAQASYQDRLLQKHYGRRASGVIPNFHPVPQGGVCKDRERVTVLWVANLKAWKQPMAFLALAEAFRNRCDVRFLMVGRGSGRTERVIRDRERELNNFQYLGEVSQDEVNALMSRAHVFVNTSRAEGFPNTFIQAWLNKVPVLSLHVNPDEVLTREGIGLCSGSIEQLIRDCGTLIDDAEQRSAMGERARVYAEEAHSVERNVDRLLQLIEAWERRASRKLHGERAKERECL